MKFATTFVAILHFCSHSYVDGACNPEDHHKNNNGYFVEGVAGFNNSITQHRTHRMLGNWWKSDDKLRAVNSTWAVGG